MAVGRDIAKGRGRESPALATALTLLARGLWPIPITPPDAPGPSPGKRPIEEEWGARRPTASSLRKVYRQHPGAGVGLRLGKDGGVIDVEVDDPDAGAASLAKLFGGELVETMGWSSRRGSHRLLAWSDRLARYGKTVVKHPELPGLELRLGDAADGGKQLQSVVPPSPNTDGTAREWNGVEAIAPVPEMVYVCLDPLLLPNEEEPAPEPPKPKPARTNGRPSAAERARALLFSPKFPESIEGQRGHDKLYRAACVLVDGFALSYQEALPVLREYNQAKAIPPESERQLDHKLTDALKNTSRSGHLLAAERDPPPQRRKAGAGANGHAEGAVSPAAPADETPIAVREWPAPPAEAAYHGLAGELVRTLEPETESDPIAILVQLLIAFGNMVGRSAYFAVEADRHYANLFCALVGPSAKARKGTSWGHTLKLLKAVDKDWATARILSGLSSGEGLIWAVRDPIVKREPIKEKGRVVSYQEVEVDAGVADKRILALEPELASPLKALVREGNILSALLRRAWDDGNLRTLTKNSPAVATEAHVSIVGHITRDELQRLMGGMEAANGFGNRFLWACVRRSKELAFGGRADRINFQSLLFRLTRAAEVARERGRMDRDAEADEFWLSVYGGLSAGKPGLLGAILGRAEAQAMRLALVYALLDGAEAIGRPHLEAALALWRYAEDSARYIFGDALGDDDAEAIMAALRASPGGLARKQISADVFGRNKSSPEITRALGRLLEAGLARRETLETGGRPAEIWYPAMPAAGGA